MADFINISQIERFDSDWDSRLAFDKLTAELAIMTKRFEQAQSNLDAIFTRIQRGDEVKLHYRHGDVVRVGRLDALGDPKGEAQGRDEVQPSPGKNSNDPG